MTRQTPRGKDTPLSVDVRRGVLTIEIGVDTLAFAALRSPWAWEMAGDGGKTDPNDLFAITDSTRFAVDVMHELTREEDDGTTPLDTLLDAVTLKAVEDGSEWFDSIVAKRDRRGGTP